MLMFCDVRICYRSMIVAVKDLHTSCTQNILPESLLSDVLMNLNGLGI